MATTFRTPGVYIEEVSKFPPSVAQVETAIPAFVGYTQKAFVDGDDFHKDEVIKPIKISSLLEYDFFFGSGPDPSEVVVELNNDYTVKSAKVNSINLLYDCVRMFYANGGGDCYIVSVGSFNDKKSDVEKKDLLAGLTSLEKEDRPTLLVIPETVHLSKAESGEVHAAMLKQCNKLQDRFAILDVKNGDKETSPSVDPVKDFREGIGTSYLKYGAAYYPWLRTTLSFDISYDAVVGGEYKVAGNQNIVIDSFFNQEIVEEIEGSGKVIDKINSDVIDKIQEGKYKDGFEGLYNIGTDTSEKPDSLNKLLNPIFKDGGGYSLLLQSSEVFDEVIDIEADPYAYNFTSLDDADVPKDVLLKFESLVQDILSELQEFRKIKVENLLEVDPVYRNIVNAIKQKGIVLPPGAAMAGIYAAVDNNRGVWKAPANVSVTAVKGPSINITHEEQGSLNIDPDGKSVNAIRAFTGKGTMVWGARTLAGNDNEWRYIPVRRFFIMAEESIKKATEQFVFEPNDANTWVRVRAMIENFLTLQWRAGALAGAKPDQAFYVRVGLGQTMTAHDILEGRMIVEIGMAVVRPAEFIVLRFSHMMQES
ncbi:phage tail sheath subtilisin-like domain-containing protein [Cytophagaceae bacterium ABcell3]|nr:phage tail sheath subtilisin-like domain-containing protein [Cytophagaceae bacterium ABcell3]